MSQGITISTAADFLRVGNLLTGFCLNQNCGHHGDVDLSALRPDIIISGPDRAPMRCTVCGSTKVQGIVTPAGAYGYQRQAPGAVRGHKKEKASGRTNGRPGAPCWHVRLANCRVSKVLEALRSPRAACPHFGQRELRTFSLVVPGRSELAI